MSEIGIIPSPDAEPYLELAKSPTGRVFRKHILNLGPLIHPKTGKRLQLDEQFYSQLKRNFDAGVSMVQVPLADDRNQHSEAPERNTGEVIGLERDGSKVYALLDIRDAAVAGKLADRTLMGASAMISMNYTDTSTGRKVGPALLHSCITNRPYVTGLGDYEEVVAATAEAYDVLPDGSVLSPVLLMLCADESGIPELLLADPEPDYESDQHEPDWDYSGGTMDEDRLRDDFGRLSLMAQQESSPRGRGWRPQYGMVVTEHDRQVAMSAEAEISDEDILAASRELAGQHRVSTDAVLCMTHDCHIRSGLGRSVAERVAVVREVALSLSRGDLYVSDDQCLALAASGGSDYWVSDAEIIRLTADYGDEFGLAHPSKSGKMVTTKTRAHSNQLEDHEDPADEDQPARGGDVHKKIRAIIERNPDLLTDGEGRTVPEVGHKSYPARSPASRERAQRRAEGGHGRGARSIEDLAAGSARMYGR